MPSITGASKPRAAQNSRRVAPGASFSRFSRSIWANGDSFGIPFFRVDMTGRRSRVVTRRERRTGTVEAARSYRQDRKSTRLNSSHLVISYAVFCLKKKNDDQYAPTA